MARTGPATAPRLAMEDALREIRNDIEEGLLDETPQYREYLLSIIEDQQAGLE